MKRLISAVLALTLLGTAGASAQSYRGNRGGHFDRGYSHSYSHNNYRGDHRGNSNAGLIGLGIGLFALAAIASSQNREPDYRYQSGYDRDYDGYYGR
jgi:hypothetical protein